jgi:hypothetical protein
MAIAFKEWALVCEALGNGEQSVILRKGGIAEGRNGFGFEHKEFYLFPTWFHGQVEKIRREGATLPEQVPQELTLSFAATIEWSGKITDKEAVHRLRELHVLDASVIEERFEYDTGKEGSFASPAAGGIHVAFVRVYRLEPPATMPMEKRFGGCRSWVELPEIAPGAMVSVLSDEEHGRRKALFSQLLGISF